MRVLASAMLVWTMLAGAMLAGAQGPPAGYRIAGRVIDTVSGDPVARAVVSVLTPEDYKISASAVTDAEGRFSFTGIMGGKYPLDAAKRGYRTSFYDEHEEFNSAIVTGEGQATDDLVFRLPPAAVLRGVVTGEGGDPVENAQVMLFKRRTEGENTGRMEQVGNTPTDDTGTYELSDLPPGEYFIAVKGDPWYAQHPPRSVSEEQSPLDVAYPITFYDSTIDENAATPLTLNWGSHEEADINMHAAPAVRFMLPVMPGARNRTGIVVQQKVFGNTVNQLTVTAPEGPATGSIEVPGLAPGTYEVEFGNPPRRMTVNATSAEVDLNASSGVVSPGVSGTLVMAGGGAVPDDISLVFTSVDESHAAMQAEARHGRFNLEAVPPGTWTVAAGSSKQTLAVLAIADGGAMAAGDKITVRDRPVQATVMVGRAQTRVEGFAKTGGKGVSGAMIMLVPKETRLYPALVRRDQSDLDGSFSLRDVPDGQYTVIAIQDGWRIDWQHRETIERWLRGGVPVSINSQSAATVNLSQAVEAVVAR
ncbi:MAG TPA: carboxypeptidase regulatory-like domain-containing protein [Terracidiphilus sp.]